MKNKINFQSALSYISFILLIVIIVVFSLIPIMFTKDMKDYDWLGLAMLIGLSIYGLPFGLRETEKYIKNRANGLYQLKRHEFNTKAKEVSTKKLTSYLPEWLRYHFENKKRRKEELLLLSCGLKDFRIIELTKNDILSLRTKVGKFEMNGQEVYFDSISDEQFNIIMAIKNGEVEIKRIDNYEYYIKENGGANIDAENQAAKANDTKRKNITIAFIVRLISLVALSLLFAMITVEDAKKGNSAQTYFNLLSRLFTLATSLVLGGSIAFSNNTIDLWVFDYKKDKLDLFIQEYENKTFKPIDEKEALKIKFEKQVEEEQKAIDSVVIPEVVNKNNNAILALQEGVKKI